MKHMLFVSSRFRLVYRPIPKCASTTMVKLLMDLSGVEYEGHPRQFFYENQPIVKRYGFERIDVEGDQLSDAYQRYQDYHWFSVVRDPYARVLSNYRNKLNRYAKEFATGKYVRGKISQFLKGPRHWNDANSAARSIGQYLSFEDFVSGLQESGVHFDAHYVPQHDLLGCDTVAYDQLIRLEEMDAGIATLLQQIGVDPSEAGEVAMQNASVRDREFDLLYTDATKQAVQQIYADDFRVLGYHGTDLDDEHDLVHQRAA